MATITGHGFAGYGEDAQRIYDSVSVSGAKGDDLKNLADFHGVALPKPRSVEKWQRWRQAGDTNQPYTVADVDDHTIYFTRTVGGEAQTYERRDWAVYAAEWHFLGYAKPDKVEVGQKWQSAVKIQMRVKGIDGDVAMLEADGYRDCAMSTSAMLSSAAYEYLGMADGYVVGVDMARGESAYASTTITADELKATDARLYVNGKHVADMVDATVSMASWCRSR